MEAGLQMISISTLSLALTPFPLSLSLGAVARFSTHSTGGALRKMPTRQSHPLKRFRNRRRYKDEC